MGFALRDRLYLFVLYNVARDIKDPPPRWAGYNNITITRADSLGAIMFN